jgi:glutamate dehydrogenase
MRSASTPELRARKVIGEGANLGVTQRGRIEFGAGKGGAINTDAIDNSAGVNSSDVEVNIKIATAECHRDAARWPGRPATRCWREMTDEVGRAGAGRPSRRPSRPSISMSWWRR